MRPKRMDGYIRQSRSPRNGDGISPTQQRERIEAWARARDVEIVAWHEDIDQSGKKLVRPGLDALLGRIEAGLTDGVAVAKLDRLSRAGLIDTLRIIERIHGAGASLASDDFGLDPTTKEGEFMLGIILGLARLEWRRTAEDWSDAKTRAVSRGVRLGPAPLGYQHRPDGRLEPSELAPVIAEMFNVAAQDGVRRALAYAREADPGRRWVMAYVRRVLAKRVYLGEISWGGTTVQGAHEPLTDLATWTRAQSAREGRKAPGLTYPLSGGPLRCATCGTDMVGSTSGGKRKYVCAMNGGRRYGADYDCRRRAWADADALEELVLGLAVIEAEHREGDAEAHPEVWPETARAGSVEAERLALESAQLRRDEFAGADLDISPEAFAARVAALDKAVEAAQRDFELALAAAHPQPAWPRSVEIARAGVEGLPAALEQLGLEVRVSQGREPLPERVSLA